MLLTTALIAGGVIYAGTKVHQKMPKKQKLITLLNSSGAATRQTSKKKRASVEKITPLLASTGKQNETESSLLWKDGYINQIEEWVDREFAISSASLGFAMVGTWLYPPFLLASVVALGYLTLETWQIAIETVIKKRRFNALALEAILLSGMLLTNSILIVAAAYWALYFALNLIAKAKGGTMNNMVNVFGEQPSSVWVQKDGIELLMPVEAVQRGDLVVVQAGETIVMDGIIINGMAEIDERMLTGESQAVEKGVSDAVFAATTMLSGKICIRVEKTGRETVAAQIEQILNQTTNFTASVELRAIDIADRCAGPNLMLSLLALPFFGSTGALAILWIPIGDTMYYGGPLGVLSYLSIASSRGLLIKDGRALELLHQVDTIVFDKTGTLTLDQPHVENIYACNQYTEDQILTYAAAAEHKQSHPIARAILQAASERQLDMPTIDEAQYEVGYGLKVQLNDQTVWVGSANFMALSSITIPQSLQAVKKRCHEQGYSLVYVAINDAPGKRGELVGAIELRPTIRPEAKEVIKELKRRHYELVIISGDHEKPTQVLAQELGIDHYFSETLPENKAELIEQLQQEGRSVCFVGDGINDGIALKKAQVSVSLRGASTVATDTAMIILMNQNLNQLVDLLDLTAGLDANMRRTMLVAAVSSGIIISGVFFLHLSLAGAVALYAGGLMTGVTNAISPLINHHRNDKMKLNTRTDETLVK